MCTTGDTRVDMLTRVACRVTRGAHIEHLLLYKNKIPVAVKNSIKLGPLIFLL